MLKVDDSAERVICVASRYMHRTHTQGEDESHRFRPIFKKIILKVSVCLQEIQF